MQYAWVNHLIRAQGLPDHEPPAMDDEPVPVVNAPKKRERKQSKKARKGKKMQSIEIDTCLCCILFSTFLSNISTFTVTVSTKIYMCQRSGTYTIFTCAVKHLLSTRKLHTRSEVNYV